MSVRSQLLLVPQVSILIRAKVVLRFITQINQGVLDSPFVTQTSRLASEIMHRAMSLRRNNHCGIAVTCDQWAITKALDIIFETLWAIISK